MLVRSVQCGHDQVMRLRFADVRIGADWRLSWPRCAKSASMRKIGIPFIIHPLKAVVWWHDRSGKKLHSNRNQDWTRNQKFRTVRSSLTRATSDRLTDNILKLSTYFKIFIYFDQLHLFQRWIFSNWYSNKGIEFFEGWFVQE